MAIPQGFRSNGKDACFILKLKVISDLAWGRRAGESVTLCLPKKFHANCIIGVQWTPDFKIVFGHKHLT